jgi:hypothetical protein
VIGSLTRCAHIARTDAPPIRGVLDLVPDGAGIPGRPDLRFRALADVMPGMRQVRQDTANAVGLYGPPGFKSPILRHCRHHAGRRRWPAMLIGTTRMKCSGSASTHDSRPTVLIGARSASVST